MTPEKIKHAIEFADQTCVDAKRCEVCIMALTLAGEVHVLQARNHELEQRNSQLEQFCESGRPTR